MEIIFYIFVIWLASSLTSPAQTPTEIVTATIILEAGGEHSLGAMEAVHEVIVNRSAKRKISKRDVCLQPSQFSCWNGMQVSAQIAKAKSHSRWGEAFLITMDSATNFTDGADHYHADYCNPYWNKHMKVTAIIGRHIFYK
jgi:spore germination cell wall hydrolase CwlJ-like protein